MSRPLYAHISYVQPHSPYHAPREYFGLVDTAAIPPSMGPYLQETPEYLPGRSLVPLCRGEATPDWREHAYIESYNNITDVSPARWARTVRAEQYRYTLFPNEGGEQLFDLHSDPDESRNLAGDSEHAATRHQMRDRLLNTIILQDYPHPVRGLFAHGVH